MYHENGGDVGEGDSGTEEGDGDAVKVIVMLKKVMLEKMIVVIVMLGKMMMEDGGYVGYGDNVTVLKKSTAERHSDEQAQLVVMGVSREAMILSMLIGLVYGLTIGHYEGLNALLPEYDDVHVLGVPCDQFGHQEPAINAYELFNGLRYVRPGHNFKLDRNFHLSGKVDVNGPNEQPLYTYLKELCPAPRDLIGNPKELFWQPIKTSDITWNFEKFLIDKNGKPLIRVNPMVAPNSTEFISELNQISHPKKRHN
ncbi:glutathione peroxidase-like [Tubulanus polymorphus]|uniref:glutathione peroxidase-like n=1 Tax=Tubulanus polymorphus TaxID=672921 RepID=UPI003DA6A0D0